MLFLIHALDKPGALDVRLARYDAHKAFLANAADRAAVEWFNRPDPFQEAGIWECATITGFIRRQE